MSVRCDDKGSSGLAREAFWLRRWGSVDDVGSGVGFFFSVEEGSGLGSLGLVSGLVLGLEGFLLGVFGFLGVGIGFFPLSSSASSSSSSSLLS